MTRHGFVVGLTCLCLLAALSPAQEVLTNGGFEQLRPDGFPADWQQVGSVVGVSRDAHSGEHALRFERKPEAKGLCGLNRRWSAHSGEQGTMIDRLKGGIRFWYKAPRSDGCHMSVYIIPMSADPLENTGSPRAEYAVPPNHMGDGEWHPGVLRYDFTDNRRVKWLHVSVRLRDGAGELLFDDVRWVEKVGAVMQLVKPRLFEVRASGGKEATVAIDAKNAGDEPLRDVRVRLKLPRGLAADPPEQTVRSIPVNDDAVLRWQVSGARHEGDVIDYAGASGRLRVENRLTLTPQIELVSATADRFLLAPGERSTLQVKVRNRGSAMVRSFPLSIVETGGCTLPTIGPKIPATVLPGREVEVTWSFTAPESEGPATIVSALGQGGSADEAMVQLDVTAAVRARPRPLYGPLWVREARGRAIGELRMGGDTIAAVPHLARVAIRNSNGETEFVAPSDAKPSPVKDSDGATWAFGLRFERLSATVTRFTCTAACDRSRQVLAFEAMHLYVNEGRRQAGRPEAILNGLEWLVGNEISSSDVDVERDHPHRIRYVQHPNMISIPYMSVLTDKGCVGLMWDVHHLWDGRNDRPQPVFASPARFEGRASHLMGLMAPNVLTGLETNTRLAARPYELAAGKTLTLTGELVLDPDAADALAVQDAWFRHHRPDPVMSLPQGDYATWFEFSMTAYLETLYDPDTRMWLPYLGGPVIFRKPRLRPDFCWELLAAAKMTDEPRLARRYTDWSNAHLARANAEARGEDAGFDYAGVENLLPTLAGKAGRLLRSRDEEGAWRFNANRKDRGVFKGMDYHALGAHNAAELGTCARHAFDVLTYARISGDNRAYQDAVTSLEYMTRFQVPRAAQVWEVPVHAPDILAASDAVEAYLEAYRFSGEPRWLDRAKRSARTGIPFVYVWNDPRYPWMRYGSIPVWGATWHRHSWFGRLVQWNGLRFAYAVLKLHDYDPVGYGGITWREWARGITISAMHQQATEGENKALWPDAYGCIDARRARWDFAPSRILKNVLALMGREPEPETVIVARGETRKANEVPKALPKGSAFERLHITSGGVIEKAVWQDRRLTVNLVYPPKDSGYTLIAGLEKPTGVMLDGNPIPQLRGKAGAGTAGYAYRPDQFSLMVRIPADGRHGLVVEGVRYGRPILIPELARSITFEFDRTLEGWAPTHDLAAMRAGDGSLVASVTGSDPYAIRHSCDIAPDSVNQIKIRMRVSAGREGALYWITRNEPSFAEDKVVRFPLEADGAFHEYTLPVGNHPKWRGRRITALRLDPNNGAPDSTIAVDWLRGK